MKTKNKKLSIMVAGLLVLTSCSQEHEVKSVDTTQQKQTVAVTDTQTQVDQASALADELDQQDRGVAPPEGDDKSDQQVTETDAVLALANDQFETLNQESNAVINQGNKPINIDKKADVSSDVQVVKETVKDRVEQIAVITRKQAGGTASDEDITSEAPSKVVVSEVPVFQPITGNWVKKTQKIAGQWRIEERTDGHYLVLNDDFKTRRAPDLKFVLSNLSVGDVNNKNAMQGAKIVALLKSAKGAQTYKLPADYQSYSTLLLHCEKYTKLWGATALP